MARHLFLFLFFILSLSCGQRSEEEVREALDVAQTLLSAQKCQQAIDLLESVGRQADDAIFLQTLASAYACRANFRSIEFISNDLSRIDANNFFRSISILSLSTQTVVDAPAYLDLRIALGILEANDKQVTRNRKFGARKAGDIGVQLMILSMVQLGKFVHFYGDVGPTGIKGGGPSTNNCFLNYTYAPAVSTVSGGSTGACSGSGQGHPAMSGIELRRRVCEGSTAIANIIDVIKNVDLSASSSISTLETLNSTVDNYRANANAAGVGHLIDLTSQAACETLMLNPAEMNSMQLYFAAVFEVGLP